MCHTNLTQYLPHLILFLFYHFCFLSGGRRGRKLIKLEQVEAIIKFILNFAAENCIFLPGKTTGVKTPDVKLLPTYITKAYVWRLYRDPAPEHGVVAQSTFQKLWNTILPYVVSAKPATDLCWTCQPSRTTTS